MIVFHLERIFPSPGKPRKTHRCNICSYTTYYSSHLQRHLLIHSGEKPFQCCECHKSFRQKQSLQMHIMSHLNN
ncbi:UNVERIFIED_CONTAM: zinc finger protein [Trichonephila clavipes]